MFRHDQFENSQPDGMAVLEVTGSEDGPRFVPLKHTALRGEVAGPLAASRLTQTYGYAREVCDKILQAAYRFPLPGDAAVTGLCARFGEVEIKAELQERSQAEASYRTAVDEGRQAALLSRESPDVLTLLLAGLEPDQEIIVEVDFVLAARAEGAGWSLRLPLTTAPRYVRSDELPASRHAQGQPLALLVDPGHRFLLDLSFSGQVQVESPTHDLASESAGDRVHISLHEGEVVPDRDCVLRWGPASEPDRPALQVWLDGDPAAGESHFLALVAPPALKSQQRVARQATLLIDHSGSMSGPKWAAADWTARQFLSSLQPGDSFNLGLFHNTTAWYAPNPVPVTVAAIGAATIFLQDHQDSGGTELGVASGAGPGASAGPGRDGASRPGGDRRGGERCRAYPAARRPGSRAEAAPAHQHDLHRRCP